MSRRRYLYREAGSGKVEAIEVSRDWTPTPTSGGRKSEAEVFDGLRAADGTPVDSRKKHRDYMRENGLALAEDYKESWARAATERADFYTTGGDHKARREAIERAVYKLSKP